ncbi:MAG: hypothetical protein K0R48_261 [Gammaproteobacteria bacterium]|jgi:hypothetical protein|nr:hypothetical protein [Gammaproteobacteria bacterium]
MAVTHKKMWKLTIQHYCSLEKNSMPSDLQTKIWGVFKDTLMDYFSEKDVKRILDENAIAISEIAWARLKALDYKKISVVDLKEKLKSTQVPPLNKDQNAQSLHFAILTIDLYELCGHLNKINVFNSFFVIQEKPKRRLWMDCADVNEDKVKKFVSLLRECGMSADKCDDGSVVVLGPAFKADFIKNQSKLVNFAEEYNTSEKVTAGCIL